MRSITFTVQTRGTDRDNPARCNCCEERQVFQVGQTKGPEEGSHVHSIRPDYIPGEGLHAFIYYAVKTGDSYTEKFWKLYSWKEMSNVEFDTIGHGKG